MIVGLEQKNLTFYSVWVDKTSQVSSLGFVPVSSLVDYGRRVAVIVAAALLLIMGENGWASANVHNGGWGSTESKWSLLHQLGSHGEGRVPRPPVQPDSLGASGPYGHNTLTGLYFTLDSFNQSTGNILSPSTHEFVFLFQKFVFIKMHLQLFSAALLLLVFSHTEPFSSQHWMMTRGGTFVFHRSASACCPLLTAETMVACLNPTPRFEIKPSLEPPNIGQKE